MPKMFTQIPQIRWTGTKSKYTMKVKFVCKRSEDAFLQHFTAPFRSQFLSHSDLQKKQRKFMPNFHTATVTHN